MAQASKQVLVLAFFTILGHGVFNDANGQVSDSPRVSETRSPRRVAWSIPSCAWKRPMGVFPKIKELPDEIMDLIDQTVPSHSPLDTPTRLKKGIPLGGIGAGNFMYNIAGSFGPWQMKPGRYEERFLAQAAFHIREEITGKAAKVRTLATEDVLPAWPRLRPGEGDYFALFPKGWFTYKEFDTDISMQFFSPIIKDNYMETSLPAAVFLFKVRNPLPVPARVAVMFTFPNAPYTGPQGLGGNGRLIGLSGPNPPTLEKSRQGLINELAQDAKGGITAILMRAQDPSNPPETEGSEWCIATRGKASYVTIWDGTGDGSDIWKDFEKDGRLSNQGFSSTTKLPSGALCLQALVAPNSEVTLPFALTWYFPQVEFGAGTRWWRRYAEYFPPKKGQAIAIAKQALLRYESWLKAINAWTEPITNNPAYPEWLKQAALNELYYNTFGSFWENGCITKPKKFGNRPGQHLEFVMESLEYRDAEALDVRHHYARTTRDLWPKIERDILLVFADMIMDTPDGSAPHDVGSPDLDPFFNYDAYAPWYNKNKGVPGRTTVPWGEFAPKFIQQAHAYWHKSKDDGFLEQAWPALVRSFRYQLTTDLDNDGISEMKSEEYNDTGLFNVVLWIGALEGLKTMAEFKKERSFLDEVRAELEKARASAEKQFWNGELGYYQYSAQNTDIMGDAMIGQRYGDVTGLPPVLAPERLTSHYRQLFRRSVLPLKDWNGDGIGDMGVANALHSDSTPGIGTSEFAHHFEVWTGVSYAAAANLYHWGEETHDGAMQAAALLMGWGVYYQSWRNEQAAYWFSTPEAYRLDDPARWRALMYPRPRGIWELLMEVHDPY